MTRGERRTQERLARAERAKASCEPGSRGPQSGALEGDAGAEGLRETRVLFTCDMLLKETEQQGCAGGPPEWCAMTCDDADDFQALKDRRWSCVMDFNADEPVVLWRCDSTEPPTGKRGYVRSGHVVKIVLAGETVDDPEMQRYALRPRAGRKPVEQYHATRETKVVLRVCAEAGRAVPWAELPELHLEEPAQDAESSASSVWKVLPEPAAVTSGKDRRYADVRSELL